MEITGYLPSGMIDRLRAMQQGYAGENVAGISVRGKIFWLKSAKKHANRVNLVVEQSGDEFKRVGLFIDSNLSGWLRAGGDSATFTVCGEMLKQAPAAGLDKCRITVEWR